MGAEELRRPLGAARPTMDEELRRSLGAARPTMDVHFTDTTCRSGCDNDPT
jgi:hypothetical protein